MPSREIIMIINAWYKLYPTWFLGYQKIPSNAVTSFLHTSQTLLFDRENYDNTINDKPLLFDFIQKGAFSFLLIFCANK